MPKTIDRELGEINATLKSIQENQFEMHNDIKQLTTCMNRVKAETQYNTEFRVEHPKEHKELDGRLLNLEMFKTKVYSYAGAIGLVMGLIGSQLNGIFQLFYK
jgi:septal ring factor EnvC (AmiA/AmiB activator)